MKRLVSSALAWLFVLTCAAVAVQVEPADPPKPFTGKVVSIADGDTIIVLLDKTQHKISLNGIDAPESTQAFGTKAKQALGDKVFGTEVKIEWTERDKYQRIIGEVYLGGRRINLEMVQEGMAWHYTQYSKDVALAKAEKEARTATLGLWVDTKPIPPWEYRKVKGVENPDKVDPATFIVYVTNTGKKYHLEGCKSLGKSMKAITVKEAQLHYEACSICKPPK